MRRLSSIFKDVKAATAVEYAFLIALIFLGIVGAVSAFGAVAVDMWNSIAAQAKAACGC